MSLPGGELDPGKVGNDAGWLLVIGAAAGGQLGAPALTLSRSDYYASIAATLPAGLEPGTYSITVEGLTDDDYQKLVPLRAGRVVAKLYLYWRDTLASIGGYLSSMVGLSDVTDSFAAKPDDKFLVATIAITKFHRQAGTRRYEVVMEGRELVYDLAQQRIDRGASTGAPKDNLVDEADRIAKLLAIQTQTYPYPLPQDRTAPEAVHPGMRATERLLALASKIELETNQHGRGMLLVRNGVLHIGPRPFPLAGGKPTLLDDSNGLVETHVTGTLQIDQTWDSQTSPADPKTGEPLTRPTYELICKGRPDLRPGDVVSFVQPAPEYAGRLQPASYFAAAVASAASMIGLGADSPSGPPVLMYVSGVAHRLSRSDGFVTTVTGVGVTAGDEWDAWTPASVETVGVADPRADGASATATAVKKTVAHALAGRRLLEIAEVRACTSKTPEKMGPTDPPSQTTKVIQGLVQGKGSSYDAPRLDIDRDGGGRFSAVPYLSPFAWGKTGLVLPRYPGMRVALEHRNGYPDDPVDIGALWGWGHGPDTKPGDYWLILPAEIPADQRASIEDKKVPIDPVGKVTNDLIDADGNRIIELATLTVRVGAKSLNNVAQSRPAPAADEVSIEHKDSGAKITMDKDGNVTIHAAKNLTISADGDINLKGKAVTFSVDSMDVK